MCSIFRLIATAWFTLFFTIVDKLNAEVLRGLREPDVVRRITEAGYEPVESNNSPEYVGQFIKTEIAKWTKVIQESGAKVD